MKIHLLKTGDAFCPATEEDKETFDKLKRDGFFECTVKQKRNSAFHRKFFAMIGVGFDAFDPPDTKYKGMPIFKDFDRFRKDVIIAAGFYEIVFDIRGRLRFKHESMSFGSMSQDRFEKLYNGCCQVLLNNVLSKYTRGDLDAVVEELIRF